MLADSQHRLNENQRKVEKQLEYLATLDHRVGMLEYDLNTQNAHIIDRLVAMERVIEKLVDGSELARERVERLTETTSRLETSVERVESSVQRQEESVQRQAEEMSWRLDTAMTKLFDLELMINKKANLSKRAKYNLHTEHPIAMASDDHKFPRGAQQDNTRYPRLCYKLEEKYGRPISFLDLGCAGGGLVFDFLMRGHDAVGLEGSDYSLRNQSFEWRLLQDHLFTCDIGKEFKITSVGEENTAQFDVITAWEVLEHLPKETLSQFLKNVKNHLKKDGYFLASVATFEDYDRETGAVYHVTVESKEWWTKVLNDAQFFIEDGVFETKDFPRGSGNGPLDWDVVKSPQLGFHVVVRHT